MRRTRRAGCAVAATAATNTMAELSPRAGTDQGENPGSFDATISAAGNAIARPRAKPPAATNTMAELSPRAGTDQGENPGSFDATISAAGNAIARPRAKPPAASFRPLARTAPMIWRGAAPRAIRMANSLDRRANSAAVTP